MFTADSLESRIKSHPFVPLRIVTNSGQQFDIYHPDLVLIGDLEITIGTASEKHPRRYQQLTRLALMHVTALEDLPVAAASGRNGEPESS